MCDYHIEQLIEGGVDTPIEHGYLCYVRAVRAYSRQSLDDAIRLYEQALEAFDDAGCVRGRAIACLGISYVVEDDVESLEWARRAKKEFRVAGDEIGLAKALLNIGVGCSRGSQYAGSVAALCESLDITRRRGNHFDAGIALVNLSSSHFCLGDYDAAVLCAAEAIGTLERAVDVENSYVWQTNGWAAVHFDVTRILANAYINCGNGLKSIGGRHEALEAYERSHELLKEQGDEAGQAIVLHQIGELLREQGEARASGEYFRLSRRKFDELGVRGYMYGVALQSAGQACADDSQYSEARALYEESLREYQSAGFRTGEAEILFLLGELTALQGDHQAAITSFLEANDIAQSLAATELVVRCNRGLGSALMHTDSATAHDYLYRALLLAEEHAMKLEQQHIHRDLASYYKLIGNSAKALSHFEKFHALQQEIFTESADRRLKNFEILHRVEQYKRTLAEMDGRVLQIESELEAKTHELVTLAARILEKQEFVGLVERGLERIIGAHDDDKSDHARNLLIAIQGSSDVRRDREELASRFLSVHHEFADQLMQIAPTLTLVEFQICVLLRLSMGAKQIADVLSVAPKTVFNHQHSIRKKLNLVNRENLKTYLVGMEGG